LGMRPQPAKGKGGAKEQRKDLHGKSGWREGPSG
jgi:hypothetical protein